MLAILAAATFIYLNRAFEGPGDPTKLVSSPNELTASFKDTRALPSKQPVLYKGISVGRVNRVDWDPDEQVGVVTFTLDSDFPVYEDAVLKIGERSLLGDAYLNIVSRGTEARRELEAGDAIVRTRPSVDFDEALDFLDEDGRQAVKDLIRTFAEGTVRPGNGERLNGTIGGVARATTELNTLTHSLKGQEEQISRLVSSASTVLSVIGEREDAVREIVGSGRATLDALASNAASLDQAMVELPRVLDSGRRSLAAADPLLREARPLLAGLRTLAPDLRVGLEHAYSSIVNPLIPIIEGLTPLRQAAEPFLGDLGSLLKPLQRLVKVIAPAARNLVPLLGYLTPRVKSIAGLYALLGASTGYTDDVGNYGHAAFIFAPDESLDQPSPNPHNAYPPPDHATNLQPFEGEYPRLQPCTVPPRSDPTAPCK